jgi:hypothetical protein
VAGAVWWKTNNEEKITRDKEDDMKTTFEMKRAGAFLAACMLCLFLSSAQAATFYKLSAGQTVYVPVYSDVFSSPKKFPNKMAVMLSIRNADMKNSITVHAADYYDTKGKLVRQYYASPVIVAPLESIHVYIPANDKTGGEGANFIVKWTSQREINVPIIESIMLGRDLSIVSPGQEIRPE